MQRMKTLVKPELIIPGHSAEVMDRFSKVAEGVVRIKMSKAKSIYRNADFYSCLIFLRVLKLVY